MGQSAPSPTHRIVTERRTGWVKVGAALLGVGILFFAVGIVVVVGQQAVHLAAAKGRARVGNPITFDANDADYTVLVTPDPLLADQVENRIASLESVNYCGESLAPHALRAAGFH